jgi:colanic acid biosynthesis glycosyl transferase WcaI
LRVQLWSYNYDPEPTGIGPVSTVWAQGLRDRGHEVQVVAAHPHYPGPYWGKRMRAYSEERDGIHVFRLPLWIGRESAMARYRQELTFMAAQFAALPGLASPDVLVSVSPSFPALLPAMVQVGVRRVPWVPWLHDILPDGAAATGFVDDGSPVLAAARRLERAAYRRADRLVVLSRAFVDNLVSKDVPRDKIELIYDPATRKPRAVPPMAERARPVRLLSMGNIGMSQGLAPLVAAFEGSDALRAADVDFVITGEGVCADDVRNEIRTDRVRMTGIVDDDRLEHELQQASIGFVSQLYEGSEFNIPSKIMNFMAYGLPVLAAVNPASEVARIVEESGAGWVVSSFESEEFPKLLAEILANPEEIEKRGFAARVHARRHFSQDGFASRFEETLLEVILDRRGRALRSGERGDLVEDPGERPLEAVPQGSRGLPAEPVEDHAVVAVSPPDP